MRSPTVLLIEREAGHFDWLRDALLAGGMDPWVESVACLRAPADVIVIEHAEASSDTPIVVRELADTGDAAIVVACTDATGDVEELLDAGATQVWPNTLTDPAAVRALVKGLAPDDSRRAGRDVKMLQALAGALSTADGLQGLCAAALEVVGPHFGWPVTAAYFVEGTPRLEPGRGLSGRAHERREVICERACAPGLDWGIAAPIVVDDVVIAVLEFFCNDDHAPSLEALDLVGLAAAQVGRAFHRQTAQSQQQLAELRYARVLDHSNVALMIDDVAGTITYANHAFCELFGVSREELPTMVLEDYVAPEWRAKLRERHDRRVRGEAVPSLFEYDGVRSDGTRMRLEVSVVEVIEHGQLIGTQSAIRNITDRHRAEQELRAANQKLSTLIDETPVAITTLDAEARVVSWNPAAERMFGWTADQVIGRFYPIAGPERHEEHRRMLAAAIQEGRSYSGYETARFHKGGGAVDVQIWTSPLRDEAGTVTGSLGVLVDVTKQKVAERMHRRLFEESVDAIVLIDPESFEILEVNPRACALYVGSREELLGEKFTSFSFREEHDEARIRGWLADGGDLAFESTHVSRDEKRVEVEFHAVMFEFQGRPAIMCNIRDVTSRKRVEDQLLRAQKMEAMGLLAGGVAHDFNNVLQAIVGFAQLLSFKLGYDHELREDADEIVSTVARASALTRQLMMFSRRERAFPERLVINDTVSDVRKMLCRLIAADIELDLDLDPELRAISVDPGQLEQVLINLAVNARDAMPSGGRLRLTTTNVDLTADDTWVRDGASPGPYAALCVSDTGHGMDEATLSQVFDPFFTTKETGRGTGLGLATVYAIVQRANGHIRVNSAPGQGTRVELLFPRSCSAPDRRDASVVVRPHLPRGRGRVLIAEDDPIVRRLARATLEEAGYEVLDAPDGESALRQVDGTWLDLVVADIVMPRMGGPELWARLSAHQPALPVLFFTGHVEEDARRDGAGDHPVMIKPFTPLALARRVRDVLDSAEPPAGLSASTGD